MSNFIVYDLETTGKDERNFIQAIQIGSIYLDRNLDEISRYDISCRPLPWTLVTPDSLLVNNKFNVFEEPLNHYEFTKSIFEKWTEWTSSSSSIFVTYNGMFFDEEILRRQFYWNLFNPYITNTNGNSRLDLLPKMYVIAKFYDDLIHTPINNGKPSFKLEYFAKSLNLDTSNAHDALGDCLFLEALLKEIKLKIPNFYQEIISTTKKQDLIESLSNGKMHFHVSRYGNSFPFVCLSSEGNGSKLPIFNLNHDPEMINQLSYEDLQKHLLSSSTAIKWINTAKTLPIISIDTLKSDNVFIDDLQIYFDRAKQLKSMDNLFEKICDIELSKDPIVYPCEYPEERIYSDGFPDKLLSNKFENFHSSKSVDEMTDLVNKIDDDKYKSFAKRICALQFPNDVPESYLHECKKLINQRFQKKGPWPDASENIKRAQELLKNELNSEKQEILHKLIKNISENM